IPSGSSGWRSAAAVGVPNPPGTVGVPRATAAATGSTGGCGSSPKGGAGGRPAPWCPGGGPAAPPRSAAGAPAPPRGPGARRRRGRAGAAVSLVTQRRTSGPAGLFGGSSGAPGRQWLEPATGEAARPLPSVASLTVVAGDLLVIQTPGGGGCGGRPE